MLKSPFRKSGQSGLKLGDRILVLFVAVALLGFGFLHLYQTSQPIPTAYARVENLDDRTETFHPLFEEQDETLTYQGPEGVTVVHLKDGAAAVTYSDCPDQICVVVFGWIDRPGQVSVCLPNRIMLQIVDAASVPPQ